MNLWDDFDGELFLDNPPMSIINPRRPQRRNAATTKRKKVTKMAAKKAPRRRRRTYRRRNAFPVAGAVVNPHRRRTRRYARNPKRSLKRRRSFRRNPSMFGGGDFLGFRIKDIAYAGAAVILAPFVEKQVMGFLPKSMAGTQSGRWAVKIGSAALIGFGAKKMLGPQASNLALIALGANLVADAVSEFAPSLTASPAVPYVGYTTGPNQPGMGYYVKGGMGYYPRGLNGYNPSQRLPLPSKDDRVAGDVPERLNPSSRF